MSSLFPHIAGIVDDICVVRSMVTEQINHDPAQAFMNSGSILKGRPSMGSWLTYGLGAETDSLPGFIVFVSQGKGGGAQPVSTRQWSSGFLPSVYTGVRFRNAKPTSITYLRDSSFRDVTFDNTANPWVITNSTGLSFTGTTTADAVSRDASAGPQWPPFAWYEIT